ncbi:MAG TPA: DUF3224 domain-containing protein [Pseudonocardiaceae bacterium]|nr:DUF3224 domain-containing protein [Pseudonocardiaceae bacterium]
MTTVRGEFEIASWDESTYQELDGERKLTRASVKQRFSGGIEGSGSVEWLMCYGMDGTARFVGMQYVNGSLDGHQGSVVFETVGDFDGKRAKGLWVVVDGSGTGDLTGLRGEGEFEAPMGANPTFMIEYDIE